MIAVTRDHGMRRAVRADFVRKQRGVNAAEDDEGALGARDLADGVSAKRVGGVNTNSHDVAAGDSIDVKGLEGLVDDRGVCRTPEGSPPRERTAIAA